MEGKALCALLQIYEVGLSCNLRESSQQMTCVHAKAAARGITHLGWASSLLPVRGVPVGKADSPDHPLPGAGISLVAVGLAASRDSEHDLLFAEPPINTAGPGRFSAGKRNFVFQGLVLLAIRTQLL